MRAEVIGSHSVNSCSMSMFWFFRMELSRQRNPFPSRRSPVRSLSRTPSTHSGVRLVSAMSPQIFSSGALIKIDLVSDFIIVVTEPRRHTPRDGNLSVWRVARGLVFYFNCISTGAWSEPVTSLRIDASRTFGTSDSVTKW